MFKKLSILMLLLPALAFAATEAKDKPAPNPIVVIETTAGDITVRLFADKAPVTVANFLSYVDSGFYNDTIFHRTIPGFMIQTGGYDKDMKEKPNGEPIVNESKNRLHNTRGTLAMARTQDPDSATTQFFINHRNNLRLDWAPNRAGYAVFGEVISGMDAVDYIAAAPTHVVGNHQNMPVEPAVIKKITRKSLL